mmetsp:Transcript_11213/g.30316  ORF Transcript_11213/g.30316 Transcript_11213/m.30316 type:complete len:110 (+) Transcript_11213:240-569(+)
MIIVSPGAGGLVVALQEEQSDRVANTIANHRLLWSLLVSGTHDGGHVEADVQACSMLGPAAEPRGSSRLPTMRCGLRASTAEEDHAFIHVPARALLRHHKKWSARMLMQ